MQCRRECEVYPAVALTWSIVFMVLGCLGFERGTPIGTEKQRLSLDLIDILTNVLALKVVHRPNSESAQRPVQEKV